MNLFKIHDHHITVVIMLVPIWYIAIKSIILINKTKED